MKILVVEDDFVSRRVIQSAVVKLGHDCEAAEDGEGGWKAFQSSPFQVIISDWMMPGMDGLELCRRVREFKAEEYCYFIILSSLDKRQHVLEGLRAGADDYLTKPLEFDELQARLISAERVTSLHRHLLNAQLQAAQANKLAAVGQLAAGVAHELNTPLGAIRLHLEGALRKLDNVERVEKKLNSSLRAVDGMRRIVSQLLNYSVNAPATDQRADLARVVTDTLGLLRPQLKNTEVELVTDLEEEVVVQFPPPELQQVLINLLTNARDAVTSEGSRGPRVEILVRSQNGRGTLQVRDQGPGIAENVFPRLFDPFFSTKAVGSGTGLGLSVSKSLVEKNQGQLSARSEPGQDTVFTIELPLVEEES